MDATAILYMPIPPTMLIRVMGKLHADQLQVPPTFAHTHIHTYTHTHIHIPGVVTSRFGAPSSKTSNGKWRRLETLAVEDNGHTYSDAPTCTKCTSTKHKIHVHPTYKAELF